jgi:hypothetical protein
LHSHSIDHCGDEKAKNFPSQLAVAILVRSGSMAGVVVGEDFGHGEAMATRV